MGIFKKQIFYASFIFFLTVGTSQAENRKLGDTYVMPVNGMSIDGGLLQSTKEGHAKESAAEQCRILADASLDTLLSVNSLGCDGFSNPSCSANCVFQVSQAGFNLQNKRNQTIEHCMRTVSPQLIETKLAHDQYEKICKIDRDSLRQLQCFGVSIQRGLADSLSLYDFSETNVLQESKNLQLACELKKDDEHGGEEIIARLKNIESFYRDRMPATHVLGREVAQESSQMLKRLASARANPHALQRAPALEISAH